MQLLRHSANPILSKNPNRHWEAGSVFNPTVWRHSDGRYGMLYRATNDTKVSVRGGYMSSIGLAWSSDGINWERQPEPLISPDQPYESRLGCEDPRITKFDDIYYIFYTAVGGERESDSVRIALAATVDFISVTKHGIIGPNFYSKAAALFPDKINEKFLLLWADQAPKHHSRIIYSEFASLEEIKTANAKYWESFSFDQNQLRIPPTGKYIEQEVGAVPIKTDAGWLFIYSGFSLPPKRAWTICAALLDLGDPRRVIAYSDQPILSPQSEAERVGIVNNVCFPEGALTIGDELYVYYGSGDQGICLATCNLTDLLTSLRPV